MKFDSTEYRAVRDAHLIEWFRGNADAVRLFVDVSTIAETWDDLVDKDAPVAAADIHNAFTLAIFGLQENPFFIQFRPTLYPMLAVILNGWLDSIPLSHGSHDQRMQAFFLRNLGFELASQIAFLTGGIWHLRKVSMPMREFFNYETFDAWEHCHDPA